MSIKKKLRVDRRRLELRFSTCKADVIPSILAAQKLVRGTGLEPVYFIL